MSESPPSPPPPAAATSAASDNLTAAAASANESSSDSPISRSGKESEDLKHLLDGLDELYNDWNESNANQAKKLAQITSAADEKLTESEKDELNRYKLKIVDKCNEKSWVSEALNDRIKYSTGLEEIEQQEQTDASRSPRTTTTKGDLGEGSLKKRRYIW